MAIDLQDKQDTQSGGFKAGVMAHEKKMATQAQQLKSPAGRFQGGLATGVSAPRVSNPNASFLSKGKAKV